jgi:hypothetical protein
MQLRAVANACSYNIFHKSNLKCEQMQLRVVAIASRWFWTYSNCSQLRADAIANSSHCEQSQFRTVANACSRKTRAGATKYEQMEMRTDAIACRCNCMHMQLRADAIACRCNACRCNCVQMQFRADAIACRCNACRCNCVQFCFSTSLTCMEHWLPMLKEFLCSRFSSFLIRVFT